MAVLSLQLSPTTTQGQPHFSAAWKSLISSKHSSKGMKKLRAEGAAAHAEPSPPSERGAEASMGLQSSRTEPCVRRREQPSRQRGYQLPEDGRDMDKEENAECLSSALFGFPAPRRADKPCLEGDQQAGSGSTAGTQHPHIPPFTSLGLLGWSPSQLQISTAGKHK